MKLTVPRKTFQQYFNDAVSCAAARDIRPILMNVKVEAEPDSLTFSATDGETSLQTQMKLDETATCTESGVSVMPSALCKKILQTSTSEKINVSAENNKLTFVCDKSKFKLDSFNADEFPAAPEFPNESFHSVTLDSFVTLIKRTIFATDAYSGRYALSGILLEFHDDKIIGVATDGRRMAMQEIEAIPTGENRSQNMTIVPIKVMKLLSSIKIDEQLKVAFNSHRFYVGAESLTVSSSLIEGKFPKWRNILPDVTNLAMVQLNIKDFLSCVVQSSIVTIEKNPKVTLTFKSDLTGGILTLSGTGAEVGESEVNMPIEYKGDEISMAFDPVYLIDFLKCLPSNKETVNMYINSDGPGVFKTDDNYTYILMPIT
jgi:DNA polymerase-3 subunit beta